MAMIRLPPDLKEFLKLLGESEVEYLLVGGYAVSYYGYPRATADMDIWIAVSPANASKTVTVLRRFGFDLPELKSELFLRDEQIVRLGEPPLRIEVMTSISGVEFETCYTRRVTDVIDDVEVNLISLPDLKANKLAAGRRKDLDDIANLP